MTLAVAPVRARASWTVSNTGRARGRVPPFPGVTPPTIFVPYAIACSEWNVPCEPVKPWQITFVSALTRIAITPPPSCCLFGRRHDLARGVVQIVGGDQLQPRSAQNAPAQLDIGAFEPYHQRYVQIDLAHRRDDALGEHVAAHDAAENVDQDCLDIGVGQDQLERDSDPLPRRAAADIEEIGRHGAIEFDDV